MNMQPTLYVGWYELLADPSLNFQLNRWAAYGGAEWLADVRPELGRLDTIHAWPDVFIPLGQRAEAEGRMLHAALHFRAGEFFIPPSDPMKDPLRRRLLPMLRAASGVPETARREVPFDNMRLPAWEFGSDPGRRTVVLFGGFDSYIEDFFRVIVSIQSAGWNVVAFEGPGQGSVLEEQHIPMTTDWHRPVGSILDAFGLSDVTLIGVSLGGCLAIRAAAFEPRVTRVVAFDVLADLFQIMTHGHSGSFAAALHGLLAIGARKIVDGSATTLAQHSPQLEWALTQAMHVFGSATPSDAIEAARGFHTRDISSRVSQDVLLLAGTKDHYVPLDQLWEQGKLLSSARSITARVFTAAEQAQAHCQIGNLPLAIHVITAWDESFESG